MKNVFKISALLITCLVGLMIPACNPCNQSSVLGHIDITGFNPKNTNLVTLMFLNANDSISWHEYGINLNFKIDYVAENQKPNLDFQLFNKAYAKCVLPNPGHLGSKEKITKLHVITLMDYDSTYSANDTIDGIFMIKNELRDVDFADFITIQGNIYSPITNFLYLTRQPAFARNAQFKIVMDLDNGEHYEGTTEVMKLRM